MNKKTENFLLSLHTKIDNLSVVTSFVENSAITSGLDKNGALSLHLAAEEVFSYLCRLDNSGQRVEINCVDNLFNFHISFVFKANDIDLSMFNITSRIEYDTDLGLESMGLFLASRSVDNFYLEEKPGGIFSLTLVKDKTYEKCEPSAIYKEKQSGFVEIRKPVREEIQLVSQLIAFHAKSSSYPLDFLYPGKLIDMFECGEIDISVAIDSHSLLCGVVLWGRPGQKTVEFYGPYIFNDEGEALGNALLDECIGTLARSNTWNMISLFYNETSENQYFEILGEPSDTRDETIPIVLFRQLKEDEGTSVWCHPELESFVKNEYKKYFFPREVVLLKEFGESVPDHSVIASQFIRDQKKVVMRPVLYGRDADSIIVEHVRLFKDEGIADLTFEMDLGVAWHCNFTHSLKKNGFEPRILIPYGRVKDLVVFQYKG